MKILNEQPDLNRKFEIEITLGELLWFKEMIERESYRQQRPIKDMPNYFMFHKEIEKLLK